MKPTSVIFLILSVILIAAGAVTCFVASQMASAQEIALFEDTEDENGDSHYYKDFSSSDPSIVTVSVKDADVHIFGTADSGMSVDLKNFPRSLYELSLANNNLTVSDSVNLFSVVRKGADGLGFTGLRRFIRGGLFRGGDRKVELAVSESNTVKQYNISVENGDIVIEDIGVGADYSLSVKNGSITLKNISSASGLNADIGTGDLTVENLNGASDVSVRIADGDASVTGDFGEDAEAVFELLKGEAHLTLPKRDGIRWYLKSGSELSLFGEPLGTSFQNAGEGESIRVTAHGEVVIDEMPAEVLPAPEGEIPAEEPAA